MILLVEGEHDNHFNSGMEAFGDSHHLFDNDNNMPTEAKKSWMSYRNIIIQYEKQSGNDIRLKQGKKDYEKPCSDWADFVFQSHSRLQSAILGVYH